MKTLIWSLILVFAVINCFAQDKNVSGKVGKTYAFINGAMKLTRCNDIGDTVNMGGNVIVPYNTQFIIDKILADSYVIWIPKFPSSFSNADTLNRSFFNSEYTANNNQKHNRYFLLSKADFVSSCGEKYPQTNFTFGIITLPIKMRFGSKSLDGNGNPKRYFDFKGEISLGISAGFKFRRSVDVSNSVLTGISITSVPVDSVSTKGLITSSTNVSSLTWHIGYLYEYHGFQIGVFTGMDFLAGKLRKTWMYKNQPWLGLGLGVTIFNTNVSSTTTQK